jgi:hypothetical protein
VVLANGRDFPDALAAAAVAAKEGAPILLTEAGSIPAATAAWHLANANTLVNVWAVGGASVISADVLTGAKGAATAQVPTLTLASVTATVTTSASFALVANEVTVSALTTGAAAGVLGNDWTVTVSATASAPGTAPSIVVSNSATPCASCTDVVSTSNAVIVTLATGGITAANLKTAFDASPAAAILSLAVGTGSTVIDHGDFGSGTLTSGQTDVKITLTFSGAVDGGSDNVTIAASSAFNAAPISQAITTASGYIISAKTSGSNLVVLNSTGNAPLLAQLTSGTAVVQLAANAFTTSAGLGNAVTTQVLTVS